MLTWMLIVPSKLSVAVCLLTQYICLQLIDASSLRSPIVVFHRLCNDLPTWMGVMLFAYNLNNCNYLLRGNASDQKKLLFTRSIQFLCWFLMVLTGGRQGAPGGHGLMVDSEYFQAVACCFVTGWVAKLGAEGFQPSPGKVDAKNPVTQCFLVLAFFILLNTFTIGVMARS